MKKIFVWTLASIALLTACDYGGRNFVYPTPLPVVLSGTPISILVPTPAPTATPQPTATPANTPTPQPTATSRFILIHANSGETTSTGITTLDTASISGLSNLDTLMIEVTVSQVTQGGLTVSLLNSTDAVLMHVLAAGNNILVSSRYQGEVLMSQGVSPTLSITSLELGFYAASTNSRTTSTFTTLWTNSWNLQLQSDGQTSGGTRRWAWKIYRLRGT